MKIHLLIIDPQNDFCDPKGSLSVSGADRDMGRLETMIRRLGPRLDDIHVTLDTHHFIDVAHPVFWVNSQGKNPAPFTIITADDVAQGVWTAASPAHRAWALEYTRKLEENKRYALCIWPPHCLIGSWGTQIYPPLFDALLDWEKANVGFIDYVTKGSNYLTEHYSALRADVPRPDDPGTQLNVGLIESLRDVDVLAIAGEALSHCVRFTTQDLIENFPDETVRKMVILEDAMTAVPGFEKEGKEFLDFAARKGIRITTTDQF
jgi:nicotinamidase-related amidase